MKCSSHNTQYFNVSLSTFPSVPIKHNPMFEDLNYNKKL